MIEAMATATCRAQIVDLANTSAYPALSETQLDRCVSQAARPDATGLLPSAAEWTPTYDVAAGVALAWRLKAGLAAALPNIKAGPQAFDFKGLSAGMLAQAELWDRETDVAGTKAAMKVYEDLSVAPEEWPQVGFDFDRVRLG
jgi:hypothetical protein